MNWNLPTDYARTISGLIIEYLEEIPKHTISIKIDEYRIEILEIEDNTIKLIKVHPSQKSVSQDTIKALPKPKR